MAIPLVYMFPNSTTLVLAGSWNNSPGDKRMNKATATTTGPQSALILFSLFRFLSTLMEVAFLSLTSNNCSLIGFFLPALDINGGGAFIKQIIKETNG
ncbi:hypothetical protein SADUNF_Sadunf16G0206800 [Salix dunnii]|uniref:Uncharacterized protein n=1 Tax=Salix dunnii TaxID=1413687 RepID=A0A835JCT4_9ROSI|nr:hypothetical protein SADUNF_Sadunf16G0206800 [Salix dunnii]